MNFYIINIFSFVFITIFWQLIAQTIKAIKYKDNKTLDFAKYAFGYFIINFIVLCVSVPYIYLADYSVIYTLNGAVHSFITWNPSVYQYIDIIISSHFFPNIYWWEGGISLFNLIIYSLIFSYCMNSAKEYLSRKYYYFLLIPFCFPSVLILNSIPNRLILGAWLFLFINVYIIIKTKDKAYNKYLCIFFAVLCSYLAVLRSEYIVLILYIPVLLFILKTYTRKLYIIFLLVFFFNFIFFTYINQSNCSSAYELHNLSYVFDEYITNNRYDSDIEKKRAVFDKVYRESFKISNLASATDSFDLSDKKETRTVVWLLTKYALKNSLYFIKRNINNNIEINSNLFDIPFSKEGILLKDSELNIPFQCSFQNTAKLNVFKSLLYCNCNYPEVNLFFKIVWSLYTSFAILLILILSSVYLKSKFLFAYSLKWIAIIFLVLIFMVWKVYLYFFAFIFNMWLAVFALFVLFIERLSKFINDKNDFIMF